MTPEELNSLKEELRHSVTETVRTVVNGKIDHLVVEVKSIQHRLDAQDIAIAPALETINTLQSGRKFILWAIPVFAFVGGLIAFLKKI
jgi:uncharacterized phage infection (PIP) family protein YhgE